MGLLVAGDPEPVDVANEGALAPFLIVCDHAGRATPRRLGALGLAPEAFERHIAYDIGAGEVSRLLGERLEACVVRQPYSRLVIDCNRAPDREDLVVESADGTSIPGNAGLTGVERAHRVAEIHEPYHARISAILDSRAASGRSTVVIAVHSFTPVLDGDARPWSFGVLHMGDSRFSRAALHLLGERTDGLVGDNAPYVMDEVDYTVPRHAQGRGLEYLEIEIRQDLIAEPESCKGVASLLAELLRATIAELNIT
jgi:predicted N-formylglutamate amidohydrolase